MTSRAGTTSGTATERLDEHCAIHENVRTANLGGGKVADELNTKISRREVGRGAGSDCLPPRTFFGVPAGELRGLHVPLDDLWRGEGARLRARLLEAPTADAKLDVIERALLARAGWRRSQRWCEPRPAVGYALAALDGCPDRLTIADISHRVGLSPRRFIQIFDDAVGLTPKLFARLRRFQRVLAATGMRPVDWAGLSAACGYFDQAHLIRDFHAFCGLTPRQYLARRTGHWNHVNVGE